VSTTARSKARHRARPLDLSRWTSMLSHVLRQAQSLAPNCLGVLMSSASPAPASNSGRSGLQGSPQRARWKQRQGAEFGRFRAWFGPADSSSNHRESPPGLVRSAALLWVRHPIGEGAVCTFQHMTGNKRCQYTKGHCPPTVMVPLTSQVRVCWQFDR
jgi:hypothetical protein